MAFRKQWFLRDGVKLHEIRSRKGIKLNFWFSEISAKLGANKISISILLENIELNLALHSVILTIFRSGLGIWVGKIRVSLDYFRLEIFKRSLPILAKTYNSNPIRYC